MAQLERWHCTNMDEDGDFCDTIFYVEGQYHIAPCCTECGCADEEYVKSQGIKHFEEVRGSYNVQNTRECK